MGSGGWSYLDILSKATSLNETSLRFPSSKKVVLVVRPYLVQAEAMPARCLMSPTPTDSHPQLQDFLQLHRTMLVFWVGQRLSCWQAAKSPN